MDHQLVVPTQLEFHFFLSETSFEWFIKDILDQAKQIKEKRWLLDSHPMQHAFIEYKPKVDNV